ncbi:wax ester/triacylglycerol synthase domain-containing protein [Spirillospora sp. NPDC048911]|uniref:wax ester/triacylglycerol synthase domain-containing protein n=1 Tax=Spirillospora sp. NPDC048911 TaxID=3364527 RepID=UPI00371C087F
MDEQPPDLRSDQSAIRRVRPALWQWNACDGAFLHYADINPHLHVNCCYLLHVQSEPPPLALLKRHIAGRLHLLPALGHRPVRGRWGTRWQRCGPLDPDDHIFERVVPAGRHRDAAIEEIHGAELPHDRPLWQIWLVHGGDQPGHVVVVKTHHAAADGLAKTVVLATLFGEPPPAVSAPPGRRPTLRSWRFALAELARGVRPGHLLPPPRTPLTGAWVRTTAQIPESRLRDLARRAAARPNDVHLAIVAGALHHWLKGNADFWKANAPYYLSAVTPIGFRGQGDPADQGNRVGVVRIALPVGEPSPARRLRLIRQATGNAQPPPAHRGAMRLLCHSMPGWLVRPFFLYALGPRHSCMLVSNLPPLAPLAVAGHPVSQARPVGFLYRGHALGFYVGRHNGEVVATCLADRSMPGAADLAGHHTQAFEELDAMFDGDNLTEQPPGAEGLG